MKHAKLCALVADDDPISRGIVAEQLMRLRVGTVRTAGSGLAALRQLEADPAIGLLVTDLKMPDMDGIALLRELDNKNRQVGVIIMSALGDKILRAAETIGVGHNLQVLGVSPKPVTLKRLRELLAVMPATHQEPAHTESAKTSAVSADDIRLALQEDGYYIVAQPELEAISGKFVGVEILSRWAHPRLQGLAPGEVILAAEQSGVMQELIKHTIDRAGKAWKAWRAAGLNRTGSPVADPAAGCRCRPQPAGPDTAARLTQCCGNRPGRACRVCYIGAA